MPPSATREELAGCPWEEPVPHGRVRCPHAAPQHLAEGHSRGRRQGWVREGN